MRIPDHDPTFLERCMEHDKDIAVLKRRADNHEDALREIRAELHAMRITISRWGGAIAIAAVILIPVLNEILRRWLE